MRLLTTAAALLLLWTGCSSDSDTSGAGAGGGGAQGGQGGAAQGGGGHGGGGQGGGMNIPLECDAYCAAYESICPEHALYPASWCEAICDPALGAIPTGGPGDTAVNSLACRVQKLEQAAMARGAAQAALCEEAHLSGGDVCGKFCDSYCALTQVVCDPANPDYGNNPPLYPDEQTCLQACQGFGTDVLDGVAQPDSLFGYGDTVQCRLHHAHVGTIDMAALHCDHASAASTDGTCDDNAPPNWANYCAFALEFCTGPDAVVTATEQGDCMTELDNVDPPFAVGSFTDSAGHTIGCMNYWIVQAPHNPEACANAHPTTGICQ